MTDKLGREPIHYAAAENKPDEVQSILEADRAQALVVDKNGFTPLHFAAQSSSAACCELLIASGADVNARNRYGNNPLFIAVKSSRGDGSIISLLRTAGSDPYAENENGSSALFAARKIANFDIAQHFSDLP
ncbi:hypothetical protein B7R21_18415 [Subtercola boreus]|uniref:Uncharacterized protein n=1 Tax=Subtercola boreus TaxID=120213 RepID=A0A3E0VAR8_9MICO|nr:ankyrin repeat domain-containing protein [Subtercola boreus]RFA06821.1 hypothetical protein B7R21_18415 [Subtercola boreus]